MIWRSWKHDYLNDKQYLIVFNNFSIIIVDVNLNIKLIFKLSVTYNYYYFRERKSEWQKVNLNN